MFGRKRSDQDAFAKIVDAYQGMLLRYATRMLNSHAAAEDVVQNVFLKCARHWKEPMKVSANLQAWLYRVTHNEALDYIRREQRRWHHHRQHAEEVPDSVPPNTPGSDAPSEAAATAAEALSILSDRERHLVTLKVYEEKSYREIADITGLSIGNVGFILHGAMKKLARHLKAAQEDGANDNR